MGDAVQITLMLFLVAISAAYVHGLEAIMSKDGKSNGGRDND